MLRARLMDSVIRRWCLAQLPDIRRGRILPRSVIKRRSLSVSLYSMATALSTQKLHTRFLGLRVRLRKNIPPHLKAKMAGLRHQGLPLWRSHRTLGACRLVSLPRGLRD